jgi:surface antigen
MTTALQAYAFGNCTYYVAERFPNIYPWLGNALNWVTSAKKQGYTVLSSPVPDTVVVYGSGNGYSSLGHVAVVDSVNADGSFMVSEMNYTGYDVVDQRRSTMRGVIGFIVPPGSSYTPTKQVALYAAQAAGASAQCIHSTSVLGATICWDGALGMGTMAVGGLLMLAGVAVFAMFALKNTGLAQSAAGFMPGPVGMMARSSTPKPKPVAPSPEEGKAASEQRVAVAKARLSAGTQAEVDAAKAGRGKRLSPAAKTELTTVTEESAAA